ncbi:5123_t:CDS:1, partial [Acaulospora colombiana]
MSGVESSSLSYEEDSLPDYYIDIPSLDVKRRKTLSAVDNADFSFFHIRACVVSGIGFFTDAYDLFVINLVSTMLGYTYFSESNYQVPTAIDTGLKISAACGTLV